MLAWSWPSWRVSGRKMEINQGLRVTQKSSFLSHMERDLEQLWRLLWQHCVEEVATETWTEALLIFCLKTHHFYLPQRWIGFIFDRLHSDFKLAVNVRYLIWSASLIVQPLYSSDIGSIESFSFFFSSYIINISGNVITLLLLLTRKNQKVFKIYVCDLSHFGTCIFGWTPVKL